MKDEEEGIYIIKNVVFIRLQQMAAEDGISPEKMLEQLILDEDSERHTFVHPYPYIGVSRFKCQNPKCKEKKSKGKGGLKWLS
ncbi:MAG: hypothetical protein HYW34_03100 [Candidatus Brennerbacteria bacterium]|nr:hypothetical protein [Candidatus Brennerbacteria bacterium]